MAPRKTAKPNSEVPAEPQEPALKAAKAPARPRAKKALPETVPAPAAPEAVVEKVAKPVAAKPARKPKAAAVKPAVDTPVAEVVAAAPQTPAAPQAAVAAPAPSVPAVITEQAQAVLQAIQDGRAVELLFVDADNNPPRTFEPRQVLFDVFAKNWFVWGWDRRYNAERHHRLDLIAQVNPVEGVGRAAQGPYKDGTPANQIGGWLGGEAIQVKAVLLKQWIFAVRQAPAPFPDFKLEDLEEGKAQVSFTATDLRAISRWVMQFGDGIQILEPQRLVDRVKQVGVTWGGKPAAAAAPAPAPAKSRQDRPERPERPERAERPEREHRQEHKSEGRRPEHRNEPKSEAAAERRKPEQPRHHREQEAAKPAKPAKVEIRFDRL